MDSHTIRLLSDFTFHMTCHESHVTCPMLRVMATTSTEVVLYKYGVNTLLLVVRVLYSSTEYLSSYLYIPPVLSTSTRKSVRPLLCTSVLASHSRLNKLHPPPTDISRCKPYEYVRVPVLEHMHVEFATIRVRLLLVLSTSRTRVLVDYS